EGAWATSLPSGSKTRLLPSKTSSSWPPTRLTQARNACESMARVAIMISRAARLPRWYGEPLMLIRSSAPWNGCTAMGAVGDQAFFADGDADSDTRQLENRAAPAPLEIALLVKDPVVGQVDLVIDAAELAVVGEEGGVVDVLTQVDEAADHGDATAGRHH